MKKSFMLGLAGLALAAIVLMGFAAAHLRESDDGTSGHKGEWMKSKLERLGLPENATLDEIKEAFLNKKQLHTAGDTQWHAKWEEKLPAIKEKLGLPEDASIEEVKEALKEHKWNAGKLAGRHAGFCGKMKGN